MPSLISLHKRQLTLPTGVAVAAGTLEVFLSGTATQVDVYADADLLTLRSQPIEADADGVLPVCYVRDAAPLRLVAKDEFGLVLPEYPMDDVLPEAISGSAADGISFSPVEGVTATDVQAAIEQVYEVASSNEDLVSGRFTPWTTGGSSNAYTLTPTPAATTYAAGQSWMVRPDRTNTGAATLNVSGIGARNVMKYNASGALVAVGAGELQQGREFLAYDDGTQIVMLLGRDFPLRTNNSNGTSTRFSDGTQICRLGKLACTTASAGDSVTGAWTFPQPFANTTDLVVHATLRGNNYTDNSTLILDAAPGVVARDALTAIAYGQTSINGTTLRVHSTDDFAIADELYLSVTAIGNWR